MHHDAWLPPGEPPEWWETRRGALTCAVLLCALAGAIAGATIASGDLGKLLPLAAALLCAALSLSNLRDSWHR